MDFFKYKNNLKPQKGSLLVSEPYLADPNFERTVIFLCEHNEDGAFGFVLNKPSQVVFDDIIEDAHGFKGGIFIGGPVQQDTLHFIHKANYMKGGVEINDGLYWGGDFEHLLSLINTKQINNSDFRFFVGYSGWGKGQLDKELEEGSWIVSDNITMELIFDTEPEELWREVLKNMGGRYNVYSNYPTDPRLN